MSKVRILVGMESRSKAQEFMLNVAAAVSERGYHVAEINTNHMVLKTKYTETGFIYDRAVQGLTGVEADALFGFEPYKTQLSPYLKYEAKYDVGMGLVNYICSVESEKRIRETLERALKEANERLLNTAPRVTYKRYTDCVSYGSIKTDPFAIQDVIFNDPATIVFWEDGTKTVVQCRDGDIYDPEKGLAMAISKKALGNKRDYYHIFKHWLKKCKKPSRTWECEMTGTLEGFNADLLGHTLGPGDVTFTFKTEGMDVK